MSGLITIAVVCIAALVITGLLAATTAKKGQKGEKPIRKPLPLTKNEQPMYFRLVEAFPEHVVLAQVAFSALITAKGRAVRNKFDRKVADFVICTKAFEVLAIIELDDSSHRGKEDRDSARDRLLTEAGYRVFRYKHVPNKDDVRNAIVGNEPAKTTPKRVETDMAVSL